MGQALRLSLLGFILLTSGCAPYLVVRGGVVNLQKLQEIKSGVAALRALEFKAAVPIEVKDPAGMKRYFIAELDREYGEERLKNLALLYGKLGLLPVGFDLRSALIEFYSSQVVAFYDPRAKKLFLPEDLGGGIALAAVQFFAQRDIMGEMVLAHELTHALQDQHFSLEERLGPSGNSDQILALRAVAEGDATLSGFEYLLGDLDETSLAQVKKAVQESIQEARSLLSDIPGAILEELLFQYYGGVSFVSRVLQERGWLGVSLLYRYPPLSTEQILHPERYFDEPDPPTEIALKSLSFLFPQDWKEIENNVLGELMVRALFQRFFAAEEAAAVAEGWDGDRLVAFRRGDEVSFIWATVWDSVEDAGKFYRRYQEMLAQKYAGRDAASADSFVEQRDRRVIVVEGLAKEHAERQIEKIWQGMVLEPQPFNAFFSRLRSRPATPR